LNIDHPSAQIPVSIRTSIVETFRVQAGLAVSVESVSAEVGGEDKSIDCISVLGLTSSAFLGSLALGFPAPTLLQLLEKMLGEKYPALTAQNADACSELLNIIYASARTSMNQAGFDFQPAIPATVLGANLSVALRNSSRVLKFKCQSEAGPFLVALALRKSA
jgi:CheY-specific phosphatase CheX